ncbi:MAG TPA: hypothetical protein VF990_00980 [Candidatus Dormibacteraeota bacterium]
MNLSVATALAIIAAAPVVVWIAWWLLADLGERATGSYSAVHHATAPRRRAA